MVAYRAALEERTRERVPLDWASTHKNLALVMRSIADHPATTDPRLHVKAALVHVDAAFEIFNAELTPLGHARQHDRLAAPKGVTYVYPQL